MGNIRCRSRRAAEVTLALVLLSLATPAYAQGTTDSVAIGGPGLSGKGVLVAYGPDAKPLPKVAAESWVLADLTTGEVLAAKSPHLARPPASTLKILTALTLIPQLDPKAEYRSVVSDVTVEGSRAGIVDGAIYTVEDLFYGLLLPSGNDAARALAHANGGVAKTVAQMNEVARELQTTNTVARSPHGLDTPGQVSSAYDLALIARAGMQLSDFRTYVSTLKYDFPGRPAKPGHKRKTFEVWNQDPLLRQGYPGTLGIKTGFTTEAGRTFVGAAERDGRTLVVTLMGIKEPTSDAARKLLSWGFREASAVTPIGVLVDPLEEAIAGAPAAQPITAAPPLLTAPLTQSATSPSASWPLAQGLGGALVVAGILVGLLALRGRRRDERGRQRMIASARRAR